VRSIETAIARSKSASVWASSCAVESASLKRKRENVPRLRDLVVASARLEPIHGRYEQTTKKKDHFTMWLRRAALKAAPSLFTVAENAQ
jgi:hypothetical protein